MKKHSYTDTVENIKLRSLVVIHDLLDGLSGMVTLTCERASEKKSAAQLGYFFAGIIDKVHRETGNEKKAIILWLYDECLQVESVNPFTGELKFVTGRLSLCNKYETAQFIDRCILRLGEMGIAIDAPEWFKIMRDRAKNKKEE